MLCTLASDYASGTALAWTLTSLSPFGSSDLTCKTETWNNISFMTCFSFHGLQINFALDIIINHEIWHLHWWIWHLVNIFLVYLLKLMLLKSKSKRNYYDSVNYREKSFFDALGSWRFYCFNTVLKEEVFILLNYCMLHQRIFWFLGFALDPAAEFWIWRLGFLDLKIILHQVELLVSFIDLLPPQFGSVPIH